MFFPHVFQQLCLIPMEQSHIFNCPKDPSEIPSIAALPSTLRLAWEGSKRGKYTL